MLASYSNTLVCDLRRILLGMYIYDKLSESEYARIDVKTLDRVAIDQCKTIKREIVYDNDEDALLKELLNAAYNETQYFGFGGPSDRFILDYFCNVNYEIKTKWDFESYLRKDSDGLEYSAQRFDLWPVFESMSNHLMISKKILRSYGFRLAGDLFEKNGCVYRAIVIDEAQDAGAPEMKMLAKMTRNTLATPKPNSLFFVGDGFQRIYGRFAILSACGIDARGGRTRYMKKNYRSTRQIRDFALPLINNVPARNLDGEVQGNIDGNAVVDGDVPEVGFFGSYDDMNKTIHDRIKQWQGVDSDGRNKLGSYAVLIRENGPGFNPRQYLFAQANGLKANGLNAEPIDWDMQPKDDDAVKVMSMHRAKGLQFDGVVLILDHWPYQMPGMGDFTRKEQKTKKDAELCLLYAAMMRAKNHLFVTGTEIAAQNAFNDVMNRYA